MQKQNLKDNCWKIIIRRQNWIVKKIKQLNKSNWFLKLIK